MLKATCGLIGIAALIGSTSALALSPGDEAARDAAVQWLQLVDAGRNDEAASQSSQEVRSFDQWVKYFADHRALLGRVNQRHFFEIKHRPTFPGAFQVRKYYFVRFKTSFEHPPSVRAGLTPTYGAASKSTAIEQVVLAKIGCCWEIFGYEISDR